jgi:hypothetical protein
MEKERFIVAIHILKAIGLPFVADLIAMSKPPPCYLTELK